MRARKFVVKICIVILILRANKSELSEKIGQLKMQSSDGKY